MNEIRTGKIQLKASILSLIVGLLAINTKAQTKASTPKQCVEQYVAWKSDPTEIDPEDFLHHKMELHWMEGEKWYKEDGRDYIQKIQAGKYLDRQQEMISIHTEKRLALVSLREIFPSEALITRETLKLEKRKGYWQITEIFISYQSIEEFTSKTSLK